MILALAVNGTYEIDDVIEIRDPVTKRRTWQTIDRVQHRGSDGKQHFYSSKPPLLPTIYTGIYKLIRSVTGATLSEQPFIVAKWMLVLVQLLPLIGLWWLMAKWADQAWISDWQYSLLIAFALFGTFLSTFVITLNNHLPAAFAVGISLVCVERIVLDGDHRIRWFRLCGLTTSFAAANELPALSWVAAAAGLLFLANWRKTLFVYLPSLLPVAIAFFGTNYLAHRTLVPPYAMRDVGELIATMVLKDEMNLDEPLDDEATTLATHVKHATIPVLRANGFEVGPQSILRKARRENVWELWDEQSQWRFALKKNQENHTIELYHWGDWYDYPSSYWTDDRKQGVDRGEPSMLKYAFHCLLGHHGIFSLTPLWLLGLLGTLAFVVQKDVSQKKSTTKENGERDQNPGNKRLALAIALVSVVVVGFYLTRPLEDRNYGGVTSGLRWVFWLVPLWYWLVIRGLRVLPSQPIVLAVLALLLAISVFSATVPWANPWTTPWLTRWIPL